MGGGAVTPVNEWLALRRVHEGRVIATGGRFLDQGRPVAEYLTAALGELLDAGLLAWGRADPVGVQRVCVTHVGQARYAELNGNGTPGRRHGS